VSVFGAPAVDGLGNAGGFKLMVEATGDVNYDALQGQADNLAAKANQQPGLVGVFNGFRGRTPQLYADIDRTKVRTMGVALTDVFDTLQVYLGGYYVNDFNRFGRTWQVNLQADAAFRASAETVKQLKVRNADGDMVPLGAVVDIRDSGGPLTVTRYNMFPAATVTGAALPGVSTGDVLGAMEALSDKELPRSMTSEWTELSFLQKQSSKEGERYSGESDALARVRPTWPKFPPLLPRGLLGLCCGSVGCVLSRCYPASTRAGLRPRLGDTLS
jgi:multidrug efflux pump